MVLLPRVATALLYSMSWENTIYLYNGLSSKKRRPEHPGCLFAIHSKLASSIFFSVLRQIAFHSHARKPGIVACLKYLLFLGSAHISFHFFADMSAVMSVCGSLWFTYLLPQLDHLEINRGLPRSAHMGSTHVCMTRIVQHRQAPATLSLGISDAVMRLIDQQKLAITDYSPYLGSKSSRGFSLFFHAMHAFRPSKPSQMNILRGYCVRGKSHSLNSTQLWTGNVAPVHTFVSWKIKGT